MRILHCFADTGVESETLSAYGDVVRIGIDPRDTNESEPVQADANALPIKDSVTFDLGVFHPPCTRWSDMPSANKNDDAPNLIPLSREIAEQHCQHHIIENKPQAPLNNPVRLKGDMFGLPIEYERAFETSFHVEQPAVHMTLGTECSTYYYADRSTEWWHSVKGVSGDYPKQQLAKSGIPAPYMHYLARAWLRATVDDSAARSKGDQMHAVPDGGTDNVGGADENVDGGKDA
jgi:hypothetical protein